MFKFLTIHAVLAPAMLLSLFASTASADNVVLVTNPSNQAANDFILWSNLGGDNTILGANFNINSNTGSTVGVALQGASSVVSVVCAANPCSWTRTNLNGGDSLLWTSDGGNGPAVLNFSQPVSGAGAYIQADGP